jgi:ABC-type uncharacterized transport system ATPase component
MKLSFSYIHRSITSLPTLELPDFVVLTGVNGAGKSHLLKALEIGAISIEDIPANQNSKNIRLYEAQNLTPNESGSIQKSQLDQERLQNWTQLSALIIQMQSALKAFAHNQLSILESWEIKKILEIKIYDLTAIGIDGSTANAVTTKIQSQITALNEALTAQFTQQDQTNRPKFIKSLLANSKIKLIEMEYDDFVGSYPLASYGVNIFQQSFSRLFTEYQLQKNQNSYQTYLNTVGENFKVLSDSEFLARYGEPPWKFVNTILEAAKLNFKINSPHRAIEHHPYEAILTDQTTGIQVKFSDLSSGERVLMSFALCLYYAKDKNQLVEYPKVLLFDEIDAPLHPSMTQSLLKTIQEILIDEHKIKVIMTTHSPTTVALVPESAIYAMQKGQNDRIAKVTKDAALSILMAGVPSLSMNYENRRQVFVESTNDVELYESIHEKLKPKLNPEISLSFIASGSAKDGGCDRVRLLVNKLVQAGNRSVFGIIDWDAKNISGGNIFVHGESDRYTLENYIFDPILLAALLFLERAINRVDIGLEETENHTALEKMTDSRLQRVSDYIINRIKIKAIEYYRTQKTHDENANTDLNIDDTSRTTKLEAAEYVASKVDDLEPTNFLVCKYAGNQKIKIPKWYLNMKGHQIKPLLDVAFPKLNKYQTEQKMKMDIVRRVIDDLPSLIPKSFFDVFNNIQKI